MADNQTVEIREITNTAEWLAWRRADVTASRIAALFDAHPFMTIDELVADMRGQSVKGDTTAMRAGRLLESAFPEAIREERPEWTISKARTYHRLPDLRLGSTPDFWINDDGLLQAKTVNATEWERWQHRPPLGYLLQTLTELIVTKKNWGVLGVIVRSSTLPLHLFDVPRHPAAEQKILDAVRQFWGRIDAGEFPEVTPKNDLEALLDDGTHKDLSADNFLPEALDRRERLVKSRVDADKELKEIDYQIKNRLGTASTAWLRGWHISWRAQHRKEYIVPAADIRVLRIKRSED